MTADIKILLDRVRIRIKGESVKVVKMDLPQKLIFEDHGSLIA